MGLGCLARKGLDMFSGTGHISKTGESDETGNEQMDDERARTGGESSKAG